MLLNYFAVLLLCLYSRLTPQTCVSLVPVYFMTTVFLPASFLVRFVQLNKLDVCVAEAFVGFDFVLRPTHVEAGTVALLLLF